MYDVNYIMVKDVFVFREVVEDGFKFRCLLIKVNFWFFCVILEIRNNNSFLGFFSVFFGCK